MCRLANENKIAKVYIHAFTDGRDCDPKSAKNFIKELEKNLFGAKIASISGRFYAMDRDKRWERIKKSYEAMVNGSGLKTSNIQETIQDYYNENITDEFIPPTVCVDSEGSAISLIQDGDAVICFNFRTDRCREITTVLTQKNMPKFQMNTLNLHYTTMTRYDQEYIDVNVLFDKKNIENTLGEVLARHKLSQTRIAETEKYPHVTYFFSGGREVNFEGEKRLMVDSPKVSTYDIQPEMSAYDLTNITIDEINKLPDFICVNFANPDMVGHTGNYKAILKAIEVVDVCTQKVVEAAMDQNYKIMIIADHGNADFAINADGSPNTAHSLNPVPCFIINTTFKKMNNGILADVAPTILRLIGVEKPEEMTGKSLI